MVVCVLAWWASQASCRARSTSSIVFPDPNSPKMMLWRNREEMISNWWGVNSNWGRVDKPGQAYAATGFISIDL